MFTGNRFTHKSQIIEIADKHSEGTLDLSPDDIRGPQGGPYTIDGMDAGEWLDAMLSD